MSPEPLQISTSPGASVETTRQGWRLSIPTGAEGAYRLAQMDDYRGRSRDRFLHQPATQIGLRARASSAALPGTWGFGLWNDPFSLSIGFGSGRRFPALPNAAWFFFASPENHLSLRDDLPGRGALAASFRSPTLPAPVLGLAGIGLPLLVLRPLSRWLRRTASGVIWQDALALEIDPTRWRHYSLKWGQEQVLFEIDGKQVLQSAVSPRAPLGLVIWLDNQYAAWKPDGRLAYGTLPTPAECWIEIEGLKISSTP